MAYTLIKNHTTVNYSRGNSGRKYIVIHYTGNQTDTAKANANYFKSVNRGASAHYFVDATTVYEVVDPSNTAWAVGRNFGSNNLFGKCTNYNSISIEMCSTGGKISDATFANTVELTKSLMKKYSIPASNVVRHYDVCTKNCPGWSGWLPNNPTLWNKFKSQISSNSASSTASKTTSTTATTTKTSSSTPVFTYAVRIEGGKTLPAVTNLNDYAGIRGKSITDIAIKVNKGSVRYRVHVKGGSWLPWVTGYNWKDNNNGYAGIGKVIDAIQIEHTGTGKKAKYHVSPVSKGYYSWQTNSDKSSSMDGYAGAYGVPIDRIQITSN